MAVPTTDCTLLVAKAAMGGRPAERSAGKAIRPPPPAMASTKPASTPTPPSASSTRRSISNSDLLSLRLANQGCRRRIARESDPPLLQRDGNHRRHECRHRQLQSSDKRGHGKDHRAHGGGGIERSEVPCRPLPQPPEQRPDAGGHQHQREGEQALEG